MTKHPAAALTLAALSALSLTGCPTSSGPNPPPPDGGVVDGGGVCGSLDHLDDPMDFVGSCTHPPDGDGNQACVSYVTVPLAAFIGTECLMNLCASVSGSWSPEACPPSFTFCFDQGEGSPQVASYYASNPASCPP